MKRCIGGLALVCLALWGQTAMAASDSIASPSEDAIALSLRDPAFLEAAKADAPVLTFLTNAESSMITMRMDSIFKYERTPMLPRFPSGQNPWSCAGAIPPHPQISSFPKPFWTP